MQTGHPVADFLDQGFKPVFDFRHADPVSVFKHIFDPVIFCIIRTLIFYDDYDRL